MRHNHQPTASFYSEDDKSVITAPDWEFYLFNSVKSAKSCSKHFHSTLLGAQSFSTTSSTSKYGENTIISSQRIFCPPTLCTPFMLGQSKRTFVSKKSWGNGQNAWSTSFFAEKAIKSLSLTDGWCSTFLPSNLPYQPTCMNFGLFC